MKSSKVKILWPNGKCSLAEIGTDWLKAAGDANVEIPLGCLGGSCGACEIEVEGKIIRACIAKITNKNSRLIKVEFATDPYWQ